MIAFTFNLFRCFTAAAVCALFQGALLGAGVTSTSVPLAVGDEDFYFSGEVILYGIPGAGDPAVANLKTLRVDKKVVYCAVIGQSKEYIDLKPPHKEGWVGPTYCAYGFRAPDGNTYVRVTSLQNPENVSFPQIGGSLKMLMEDAQNLQGIPLRENSTFTQISPTQYAYELEIVPPGQFPVLAKYTYFTNENQLISQIRMDLKKNEAKGWQLFTAYRYAYAKESRDLQLFEQDMVLGGKSSVCNRLNVDKLIVGPEARRIPCKSEILTTGTHVEDSRVSPTLSYVTEGAALLSDEEVFALAAKRKAEHDVRLRRNAEARSKAAARAAVANDPHNMKDVPVTGESWGNRLRRIPNWAYGGAVVLFLGGWIVAASRRRKK